MAKHFFKSRYLSLSNCPIGKAAQDFFNVPSRHVNEGVTELHIGQSGNIKSYAHMVYGEDKYANDKMQAFLLNFDETIIFELELTPSEPHERNI